MRERVEDLGRLAVLIEQLLEDDFFEKYDWRPKDFSDLFDEKGTDEKDDILRHFAYGRQAVFEALYKMQDIALGTDTLNDPLTH